MAISDHPSDCRIPTNFIPPLQKYLSAECSVPSTEFCDLSVGFGVFRRTVKTILFARY